MEDVVGMQIADCVQNLSENDLDFILGPIWLCCHVICKVAVTCLLNNPSVAVLAHGLVESNDVRVILISIVDLQAI